MKNTLDNSNLVFSLDIGTRTIIGLVGRYENEVLTILASETMSHEKRAMYDGQIHDIGSVVKVAKKVKETLESKIGFPLERVAVAAAGRSLEVSHATVTVKIDSGREIDKSTIKSAELETIIEAEKQLKQKIDMTTNKYYCVGHTVVKYFLDDTIIENLEGHMGSSITIDAIATFLPHTVVDSLSTVMNRLDLEIVNMTLEPIAAISIAVKKNLRLLNIALVDIGAGTSDIAITKDGTINSYAMVPTAGDEITEALVKSYLLDYDIAEQIKVNLSNNEEHEFQDILGLTYKLSREEILDKIDDSIKLLAEDISEKLLRLNEGPPSVVFLIGGGAQIQRLENYIAESLEIPKERVTIKDASLVENIVGISDNLKGPDAITPLGIAIMSLENNYRDFIEVVLNDEKIKLFSMEKSTITDALLKAKFNPRDLVAKRGKTLTYYIDGVKKEILGKIGQPARVYLNGETSSLEKRVKNNDKIIIEKATKGQAVNSKLSNLLDLDSDTIEVFRNQVHLTCEDIINDGDKLETRNKKNIELEKQNLLQKEAEKQQEKEKLIQQQVSERVENKKLEVEKNINNNKYISLIINGQIQTIEYEKEQFQFVDIFDHIDFDLTKPKGDLILKINNKDAEYLEVLKSEDRLDIRWEKQ